MCGACSEFQKKKFEFNLINNSGHDFEFPKQSNVLLMSSERLKGTGNEVKID